MQSDVDHALLYVFLCYVAFFGTGNVASISSFTVSSTYRFTTVFAPFLMGVILVWKLLIPNIVVALAYACVQHRAALPPQAAFLLVTCLSEVITLNFFFLVQDSGSWYARRRSIIFRRSFRRSHVSKGSTLASRSATLRSPISRFCCSWCSLAVRRLSCATSANQNAQIDRPMAMVMIGFLGAAQ